MKHIAAGNVEFLVETSEGRNDGGPSVQVVASVEGHEHQLLRFDCFRNHPHYHYDPMGKDERYNIDVTLIDDSLGWVLGQLRTELATMIARAGQPAIASGLDMPAVAAAIDEAEAHFRAHAV